MCPHRVRAYAARPGSAVAAFVRAGGRSARSIAAAASEAEIVITMLPNGGVVQQVALGEDGLVHGLRAGALLLDCSSAEPWLTEATAKALNGVVELLTLYEDPRRGYPSKVAPQWVKEYPGDYDHLARVFEWSTGGDGEGGDE